MKTFTFCFLLMLGCFINQISAQSDSLITELEKTLQLQIDSLGEEHLNIAMYCDSLGWMYMKRRKYAQANSLFTKALDIKTKKLEEKHPDIVNSYHNLGHTLFYTGNYEKAISYNNKALNIRIEVLGEKHPNVAKSCYSLGLIYAQKGEYKKAISFYSKTLNIRLEVLGEKHPDVARCYNNLGEVYRKTGDYEKATSFHNKALDIRLEILDEKHFDVASSYSNIGNIYAHEGDYEKALSSYNKALNILIELFDDKHPYTASVYNNLGNVYCDAGNYEKAISFHHKTANILLELFGEKHPYIATSYNNLGNVYKKTDDYEKAISFYNKALNIWLEISGEKHPDIAKSYNSLGEVYSKTGDHKKAISFHKKALDIILKVFDKKHPNVAICYNSLGNTYSETNDYEKAISFYSKALSIHIDALGKQHPYVRANYINLAIAHERIDNCKITDSLWHIVIPRNIRLLKSTYLFLPNDQRLKYSNTLTSTNTNFYSFAAINGTESIRQLATNYLLNTKSLALDYTISTNQLIQEIKDTTLIAQHQQLNKLNKQLADVETLTTEERKEKGWNLSKIQEEQEALAFQMLQHPQLKSKLNTKTIEWQDIQNHLAPAEATIDFIELYEKQDSLWAYYAIVIRKDLASPQFVRITDEKTLAKPLKTDKEERPGYLYDRRSRKALYKALWQPLKPYLESIKTVHISPSGILYRVPFESLQDTGNEYLAAQYEFHYYSSIRDMLKEQPRKMTYKNMVLLGHILYDLDGKNKYNIEQYEYDSLFTRNTREGIRPLKNTLEEVSKINKVGKKAKLNTTMLTIDAASEDTMQYFVQERAPSIIHFATHGVFLPPLNKQLESPDLAGTRDRLRAADNPLQRSALMLYGANETWTKGRPILGSVEDGILTALEVTALDLQNTDLVVLSACSTGLGNVHNTEGVFGLQRAFKLAGVNHVVASLWDVDDEATKDLMVAFYKNLLQKKQDPATALRNAKDKLREAGYESQDWAGFILIE